MIKRIKHVIAVIEHTQEGWGAEEKKRPKSDVPTCLFFGEIF
jgi:hypothetical protein